MIIGHSIKLPFWTSMAEKQLSQKAEKMHVALFQCDEYAHCCDLVDFAIEMKQKLEEINKHSFNRFQLRIGMRCMHASVIQSLNSDDC